MTVTTRQEPCRQRGRQLGELLVPADQRCVEPPRLRSRAPSCARRARSRAERASSTARLTTRSRAADDLAGRDPRRQAELLGRRERPVCVVVARSLGAEDRDQPLGPESLEQAAVAERARLAPPPASPRAGGDGAPDHRPSAGSPPARSRASAPPSPRQAPREHFSGAAIGWILPQDSPLELLQLRRGVEAELVGQREPRGAVDLERFGLPAAAVERRASAGRAAARAAGALRPALRAHRPALSAVPSASSASTRSSSAATRSSSSRAASRRANSSSSRSASAGPRQSASASLRRGRPRTPPRRRAPSPAAVRSDARPCCRARARGGSPGACVTTTSRPSTFRSAATVFWSEPVADAGARSPHRSATSRSVETTSPARSASAASRARCWRRGSATVRAPSRTSSGPSRRISIVRVVTPETKVSK